MTRWRQVLCLALVLTLWGCAKRRLSEWDDRGGLGASRYPAFFLNPVSKGHYGFGFAQRYPRSVEESYRLATEQALRLYAWSSHVRVKGVRQFEQTAGGYLEYRGQQIDLLELSTTGGEECNLDTLTTSQHVWIIAAAAEGHQDKMLVSWSKESPPWITHSPPDEARVYALGIEPIALHDEAGSWELATYDALVDLAFEVGARFRSLDKVYDQTLAGAQVLETDTVLRGFRVVARWRDDRHVYVLAGVSRGGAVSNLE